MSSRGISFKSCSFFPLNDVPDAILIPSTKIRDLLLPSPLILIVDMPIELFDCRDELEGSMIGRLFKKSSILKMPFFFKSKSLNSNTELVTSNLEFNEPVTIISSLKS